MTSGHSQPDSIGTPENFIQLAALKSSETKRIYTDVRVIKQFFSILVDTGATNTVFNFEILSLFNSKISLTPENGCLTYADGRKSPIVGSAKISLHLQNKTWTGKIYFVKDVPFTGILGMDVMSPLGMVVHTRDGRITFEEDPDSPVICSTEISTHHFEPKTLEELCKEAKVKATPEQEEEFEIFQTGWKDDYQSVTGEVPDWKHVVYIKPDSIPQKQKYYPLSPAKLEIMLDLVDDLIAKGFVEESTSAWSSPALLVPKQTGGYRLAIDYRKLNACTIPYAYPLPYMREIFSKLKSANFISTIDLESGYYQILMDEGSKHFTAFTVPMRGLLQFRVMPFGLMNAPATFQNCMNSVLRPVIGRFAFAYMDDTVAYSEDFRKHVSHLDNIYRLLFNANLKINWSKCKFLQPYVEYLGYIVGQGEMRVSTKKIVTLMNFPTPKNQTNIRSFMGLINFYRMFIPNCAEISEPLNNLLRLEVEFTWTDVCQQAFQTLKDRLIHYPVLRCPDFDKPFIIEVDASGVGLGAVLIQYFDNFPHPIAFGSKTLSKAERNYSTTERECLAILFGIEHFKEYVDGTHFKVITDHQPLQWLKNLKNPTGRLARWVLKVDQYSFDIEYRKGKDMVVADSLSRIPDRKSVV